MGKVKGSAMNIKIGATPVVIAGWTNISIDTSRGVISVTDNASAGRREILPGTFEGTITADCFYDDADAVQTELWTSIYTGVSVDFEITVGTDTFTGSGYCTAFSTSGAVENEMAKASITIDIDGAVVRA